ncbi:MAG TPA: glycosyltransferase, partial [Cryptosporangiaceae bacterium]|nr:glycosyltransferase [Cryptosporangiaceae bacterium]
MIVTRDRRSSLVETLARLRALPERPPLVVVDNGSTDGTTAEVRERWPEVTLVSLASNLGAAGRTAGVRAARTPFVAFSDDDSWWEPGALAHAGRLLAETPRLGLVAARVMVRPAGGDPTQDREDPVCAAMTAGPRSTAVPDGHDVLGFLACGAVVRRDAYLSVGGFHPRYGIGGEEELLALDLTAAGWRCCHVPAVVAVHSPDSTRARPGRRRREVRNALWTAWLRRRPAGLVRRSLDVLGTGWTSPQTLAGLGAAVAGLPWVLGERAAVDRATEAWRSMLDRQPRHAPR